MLAGEIRALGVPWAEEPGGVAFGGGAAGLYRANLRLRTAGRILVRLGAFDVRSFFELERHARRIGWARVLTPGRPARFRVTCKKSRLYHSDAVAERLMAAAARVVGAVPADGRGPGDEDAEDDASVQLFVVRLLRDELTLGADSSGTLLHRRGYRQAVGKAPLRETLAAGILLAAGWDPATALVDPLAGSGTIAIEGAMLARRIAPGLARARAGGFAFLEWPERDAEAWTRAVAEAESEVLPAAPAPILASDRDAGAVEAMHANAERAGVAGDVAIRQATLSETELPTPAGLLATNPPYGVRASEGKDLRGLYARIGDVVRRGGAGWRAAVLSPDPRLDGQLDLPSREVLRTTNGGIGVRLVVVTARDRGPGTRDRGRDLAPDGGAGPTP